MLPAHVGWLRFWHPTVAKLHFWITWFPCWSSMHLRTLEWCYQNRIHLKRDLLDPIHLVFLWHLRETEWKRWVTATMAVTPRLFLRSWLSQKDCFRVLFLFIDVYYQRRAAEYLQFKQLYLVNLGCFYTRQVPPPFLPFHPPMQKKWRGPSTHRSTRPVSR